MNKTGNEKGELDGLIKPFFRFSIKYSRIFPNSGKLIL
jgi:hypothetical protein